MQIRNEFPKPVKDAHAKRVGFCCSNPDCQKLTSGPRNHSAKSVNIGVAAHITAASQGGPRYKGSLSMEKRRSVENGIWLCQNCAKLIDNDQSRYSIEVLNSWKAKAEKAARAKLEGLVLDGGKQANAAIFLNWKTLRIQSDQDRHEYKLEVSIENLGPEIITGYHLDLEFPTRVLVDSSKRVEHQSDSEISLFRKAWHNDDDNIYPNDKQIVITILYYMDQQLFFGRGGLFDQVVRATFYHDGQLPVVEERCFGEFQCF